MKKTVSLILAILMIFSVSLSLTSCGGGISAEDWQAAFDGNNFAFEAYDYGERFNLYEGGYCYGEYVNLGTDTEPDYRYQDYECYGKTVDGTTTYYKSVYEADTVEITAADMEYDREYFAPLLDFIRDNQSLFTRSDRNNDIYYYEGELPAGAKAWIDEHAVEPADAYSIEVQRDYTNGRVERLTVFTNTRAERDEMWSSSEWDPYVQFVFYGFGYQICLPLYLESVSAFSNYTVVGGEGENYMELSFDGDNFRMYTPNVPEGGYVEAIFANEEGVFNYYKREKDGPWIVETLDEDVYRSRVGEIRNMFGGGAVFSEILLGKMENGKMVFDEWFTVDGGKSGLFRILYTNLEFTMGDNYSVTGAAWNIRMQQENMGDAVVEAGRFVMTLDAAEITVPDVK